MIDLARWLVGEITVVSAQLAAPIPMLGLDGSLTAPANQSALLAIEFANGVQGSIHVSAVAHVGHRRQDQHVVLHGEAGSLEVDFNLGGGMRVQGARTSEPEFQLLPIPDRIWGEVDHARPLDAFVKQPVSDRLFVDAIVDDLPVSPSFLDGLKAQQVIDAAIASATCEARVRVPLIAL